MQQPKILVVGAGGLGCEILKGLVCSGFLRIEIVDLDTIEMSNLNRQFLFTPDDIGKSKAQVAAAYFAQRGVDCLTAHFCALQDLSASFYASFDVVVCAVDSVEARRWLNSMLHSLVVRREDGSIEPSSVVVLIDGGSEGFSGTVRVVVPYVTPCIECVVGHFSPAPTLPICMLASRPRSFEHCIEYAAFVEWQAQGSELDLDVSEASHAEWLLQKAIDRAEMFGIHVPKESRSKSYVASLLQRVVPALSSTNAVVAGLVVHELVKIAFEGALGSSLDNFILFNASCSFYAASHSIERNKACCVCALHAVIELEDAAIDKMTLQALLDVLRERQHLSNIAFIRAASRTIYSSLEVDSFRALSTKNISQPIGELVSFDFDTKRNASVAHISVAEKSVFNVLQVALIKTKS